jgi:hypothetical protein
MLSLPLVVSDHLSYGKCTIIAGAYTLTQIVTATPTTVFCVGLEIITDVCKRHLAYSEGPWTASTNADQGLTRGKLRHCWLQVLSRVMSSIPLCTTMSTTSSGDTCAGLRLTVTFWS